MRVALPFTDIMEVALALLALSPDELTALGWTFADRKRLLDHFLASGKQAQNTVRANLDRTLLTLRYRCAISSAFSASRNANCRRQQRTPVSSSGWAEFWRRQSPLRLVGNARSSPSKMDRTRDRDIRAVLIPRVSAPNTSPMLS